MQPIPMTYFGMHIHSFHKHTPWPAVPFGTWRAADRFSLWSSLEPSRGRWKFDELDKCVDAAAAHRVEMLITLAHPPQWASARPQEPAPWGPGSAAEPRDLRDWQKFVRTVATRFRGRVRYYEIWNEPNWKQFFTGRVDQMVDLARSAYRILKEVDPSVVVVSPPGTYDSGVKWLDEYLSKGGGAYADVVGFHFYVIPGKPEDMLDRIDAVREVLMNHGLGTKPLWNTETGWLIANRVGEVKPEDSGFPRESKVLDPDEAAGYVARALILGVVSGLQRFYWYAWDDGGMGLAEPPSFTEVKPAGRAYARTVGWLVGNRIPDCVRSASVWRCRIEAKDGGRRWIVWSESDRAAEFQIPAHWPVTVREPLLGQPQSIPDLKQRRLTVDGRPCLLH